MILLNPGAQRDITCCISMQIGVVILRVKPKVIFYNNRQIYDDKWKHIFWNTPIVEIH